MIIYDVVNIFSMKNYKSSRKLRVGLNWYPGVNWSTTTTRFENIYVCFLCHMITDLVFVLMVLSKVQTDKEKLNHRDDEIKFLFQVTLFTLKTQVSIKECRMTDIIINNNTVSYIIVKVVQHLKYYL